MESQARHRWVVINLQSKTGSLSNGLKQPLSREGGIDPGLICRLMNILIVFFLMTDFI